MSDLKPCPLCGEQVSIKKAVSPDGSMKWIIISHGLSIPCGITFTADEVDAVEKWNTRVVDSILSDLAHYGSCKEMG